MATLNGGSETLVQIWSQNLNSLNVYLFFFFKGTLFFMRSTHMGKRQGSLFRTTLSAAATRL